MKRLKVVTGESLDLLQEFGLVLIALAILVIRYGHTRYPYDTDTGG